jgi:C4-dicarboxylate-specific signal transduction histidine kinase
MGQLAASIAHEVNQPIAGTVTSAEAALRWLSAEPANIEKASQGLRRIVNDGNRAAAVVGRIRDLIRKAPPLKEMVNLNAAIGEVIELTRGEATKHGASVRTQLADDLPFIEGDRVQLQQVLLNLVINAIEAVGEVNDGVRDVTVTSARAEPGWLRVTLRDSGPGLSPGSVERVFTSFYTTKPNGLGMGLSICRSIIEAHGGRLWASPNVPCGAIFQFAVPVHADVAAYCHAPRNS